MKSKLLLSMVAVFAMACSADDVKELTRQDQTFVLTQTAPIAAVENGPLTYSVTKEFDATADVAVFTDKIDKVTLNSVTMMISDYSTTLDSDVSLTAAVLTIDNLSLEINSAINLADADASNAEIALTLPAEAVNLIQAKLLADKKLSIELSASVDKVPVNFTVELNLDVTVSGTIL